MASASGGLHEPWEKLTSKTKDMHRALVSVQEELEAVDWYRQRADACEDEELRGLLLHNAREEVEHAAMLLEWLRRNDADFNEQLGTYLFTDKPIMAVEEEAEAEDVAGGESDEAAEEAHAGPSAHAGLTVGTMKGG